MKHDKLAETYGNIAIEPEEIQPTALAHRKRHLVGAQRKRAHIALAGRQLSGDDGTRYIFLDQVRASRIHLDIDGAEVRLAVASYQARSRCRRFHI